MSLLEQIGAEKRLQDAQLAATSLGDPTSVSPARCLHTALAGPELSWIAEIKRRSPTRGDIRPGADPVAIALSYAAAGASAISVLTDAKRFGGSLDDLSRVRAAVQIPVLRKDFLVSPRMVLASRIAAADSCLLIVAMLSDSELSDCLGTARELGMEPLVEVHDASELDRALRSGARIVGINNRNLHSLAIDLATAEELLPRIPDGIVRVAESGVHTHRDRDRMRAAGADALLVGTALMSALDPGQALRDLRS
jgi:indole-3-glycerol phosphate synthase